jgi:hypothetical protein
MIGKRTLFDYIHTNIHGFWLSRIYHSIKNETQRDILISVRNNYADLLGSNQITIRGYIEDRVWGEWS